MKEKVVRVHHWTDTLFSFTTSRDQGFRFKNGHFTMIGLQGDNGRPLMRAYSMVSANYEETLEFFSIKVPDGPLASRLQHLKVGDEILVRPKTSGTLVAEELLPGNRLFLLRTGTGLAPFIGIIKDPKIYEAYDKVILVHGTRLIAELAYQHYITGTLPKDKFIGDVVSQKLTYYPTVTREPHVNTGHATDLIKSGALTAPLGIARPSSNTDLFCSATVPACSKR